MYSVMYVRKRERTERKKKGGSLCLILYVTSYVLFRKQFHPRKESILTIRNSPKFEFIKEIV